MQNRIFNIRVYGILINEKREVLIADEYRNGRYITKFPGGGMKFGEGTINCLKRECMEELNVNVEVISHFYTTDFFQLSAFNENHQIISIYYTMRLVGILNQKEAIRKFDFNNSNIPDPITFRWIPLLNLSEAEFTFPIDKKVTFMLRNNDV